MYIATLSEDCSTLGTIAICLVSYKAICIVSYCTYPLNIHLYSYVASIVCSFEKLMHIVRRLYLVHIVSRQLYSYNNSLVTVKMIQYLFTITIDEYSIRIIQ